MKVFWGLVVVLALAAGVLLLARRPSGPAPASPAGTSAQAPAEPSGDARGTSGPTLGSASVPPPADPVVEPAPKAETPTAAVPAPTPPVAIETTPTPTAPTAPAAPVETAGVPIPPEKAAEVAKLAAALGEALTNLGDPIPSMPVEHTPVAAAGGAGGGDPAAPAKVVPQPDGSVLVDDRFTMRGSGTKDDPYVVTWELLLSARETYQPRLGKKIIPDRLKRLDGKWIRIGGYTAFPIMAQSADEMLVMLNQWDGCCIGVPPTPYDAVEVRLARAAEGEERTRVSGTLKGILRVDPYLVKDWLVSLYLMDEGVLTAGQ